MADEHNAGLPPEYADGRVCHFTTVVSRRRAAEGAPDARIRARAW